MQKKFLTNAATDQRQNFDREFAARANQAQRKDCERILQTKRAADGVEVSMFDDVKPTDEKGNISLF